MRRLIILLSLTIFLLNFISAGGVSITPVHYKEYFEPYLEKQFTFNAFNVNPEKELRIYIKGDLENYTTISDNQFKGRGEFTVSIKLPGKIEKPGRHSIYVGAIESNKDEGDGNLGGIAAVEARIDILVPYPGKYAESTFIIQNINQGEEAPFQIETQNLGTQDLTINTKIEIYKNNMTEKVLTKTIPEQILSPKATMSIMETLNTKELPAGEYQAVATIDWGEIETIKQEFLIGEFLVEVIDYDYLFERGRINQFNIVAQNKWNTKIDEIYANVHITDEGKSITSFKTISIDTAPWETKNLTGYFDATNLESKRYIANIMLSYGDKSSSKLVAIYIKDPPSKNHIIYIIIASILALIIIATFIYLIIKIIKLKKQNANKK